MSDSAHPRRPLATYRARRMTRAVFALAAAAIGAGVACEMGPTGPPTADKLVIVSGNGQTGTVSQVLASPLVVRVDDAKGNPLGDFTVHWQVTGGGGAISATSTQTARDGTANVTWTLGTTAGTNTLTASVGNLAPVTFTATGEAGPPASVEAAGGDRQTAPVNTPVPFPPAVVVRDAYGNAVPGVSVTFTVTAGGGSVTRPSQATDADGRATAGSWTLGTTVGTNTLTASVSGGPGATLTAWAEAGPPGKISIATGNHQSATVGTAVPTNPAVLVQDAFGNPVWGASVAFTVTGGGGGITDGSPTSDAAGIAAAGSWTLGTTAGTNTLTASVGDVAPVTFTATGEAGPPASVVVNGGDGQSVPVGTPVPEPPSLRVTDQYGNPVPVPDISATFSVTSGGGSVTGANPTTDSDGVAAVGSWVLGTIPGTNTLTGTAVGQSVTFTATGTSATLNLFVAGVHLNQANQDLTGTIGGVASRPGLLRVVVQASDSNAVTPEVRVRLYRGATLVRTEILTAPQAGIPTSPDLRVLSHSYNLALTAGDVVPGLRVDVLVDPGNTVAEPNESDNVFPAGGGTADLDVQSIFPFNVVWIPIHATVHGTTGSVNAGNTSTFLRATRRYIPTSTINSVVQAPFTTGEDLSTGTGWSNLLAAIQAKRDAEGATDQYYHGIIGDFSGKRYGGLAYVPSSNGSRYRSALSHDRSETSATETVAHEFGHNLGRLHAPCGGPSGVDGNYPYPNAEIGPPGYNIDRGYLITASAFRDYMSYCGPEWTSDYTYERILTWRRTDPLASQAGVAAKAARSSGLLIWGRMGSEGVLLNPAFVLEAPPSLPDRRGPNVLRALAADGSEVFRFTFEGVRVADSDDPQERHFSFFVPLSPAEIRRVERIELATPRGTAAQVPGAAGAAREPAVRLDALAGGRARLRWDAERYPMAMLRDPATGRVLGFFRTGDVRLPTGPVAPGRLEVLVSDGVRSQVARPR